MIFWTWFSNACPPECFICLVVSSDSWTVNEDLNDFIISGADTEAGGSSDAAVEVEEETPEYEILEEEEMSEGKPMERKEEEDGEEEKRTFSVKEEEKPFEGDEEGEEEEEEEETDSTTADVLDACVVRYSVKTTPFLQRYLLPHCYYLITVIIDICLLRIYSNSIRYSVCWSL